MAILRQANAALALALLGNQELWRADLFEFYLSDGVTEFDWAAWSADLVVGIKTYQSKAPWLKRSKWNVTYTMEVPSLVVYLMALNDSFAGGASIKAQIHNGLFDGAKFALRSLFMQTPGVVGDLGDVALFDGKVAGIDLIGSMATITIKGRSNDLDQYAPHNIYQIGCNNAFCDADCTLARATFTASYVVGASPTNLFIPWASVPGSPTNYIHGTLVMTSGAASGARRTIEDADSSGLTLAYPLYATPAAADTFTAFEGCDKSFDSGSGRSCTDRSNTQNYDGYEFIPEPSAAI